jgi:hypothetical protein
MKKIIFCAIVSSFLVLATAANAHSAYDGSWNLVFVTRSGVCDATYNFTVDISNGIVTHPNLVKFRGYVARSGAVRASVTGLNEAFLFERTPLPTARAISAR